MTFQIYCMLVLVSVLRPIRNCAVRRSASPTADFHWYKSGELIVPEIDTIWVGARLSGGPLKPDVSVSFVRVASGVCDASV